MALEGILGQYVHRQSVVHALDPRTKFLALLACIILAFVADSFGGLVVLCVLLAVFVALARLPLRTFLQALAPLSILLIFPLVFNLFFIATGEVLVQWGPVLITSDGLARALYLCLRLFFLFAVATLFTLSTSTIAISDAVRAGLEPLARFGVPAVELSMMVSISLRFVPTLVTSFTDIREAQQARGADLTKRNPLARLRALVATLVPLFAQALRHAEELALAMESRCFHGGERTHYRELRFAARDALAAVVLAAAAVVLITLRIVGL